MASPPTTRQAVARLAAGVVIAVALLTWWGGWALPVVVAAILAIIMLHEFGHFVTAKRAGMSVTDFFVGFGPVYGRPPSARPATGCGPSRSAAT